MAQIEKIVPFILFFEAGGAPSCYVKKGGRLTYDPSRLPLEKQFYECRKKGLANDPNDRGGLTMCGVTIGTYSAYCKKKRKDASPEALKALKYEEWLEILKTMFWDKWKADDIADQSLANILVDWAWASGITGIKRPQRMIGVVADGIVGPKTITAVNSLNAQMLFAELHADRLKHFDEIVARSPSQSVYLKGWRRRVNSIEYGRINYLVE